MMMMMMTTTIDNLLKTVYPFFYLLAFNLNVPPFLFDYYLAPILFLLINDQQALHSFLFVFHKKN